MAPRLAFNALARKAPGDGIPSEPEAYGLHLADPVCRERARGVFQAFFAGMEAALRHPWQRPAALDGVTPLYAPFHHEGASMGHSLARSFTLRRQLSIAAGTFSRNESFAFMKVIGVGFAAGFVRPRAVRAARCIAARFGNYGDLVHDGRGFAIGLFRWRGGLGETLKLLDTVEGAARFSTLSGLGRSLWFRFMDRPQEIIDAIRSSRETPALLGGLGLASAFTFPGELERGYGVAGSLLEEERAFFLKGIRIALFVRQRDQEAWLRAELARQGADIQRRAEEDLEVALAAHDATCEAPDYIYRFHERCVR